MKKQSTPFQPKTIGNWLLINLVIGFSIPLIYATESFLSLDGWGHIWDDIIYCFLVSMGISGTVGFIERFFGKRYSWIKEPGKRFILEFLLLTAMGFSLVLIINFLFYWAFGAFTLNTIPWNRLVRLTLVPMLVGYVITMFFTSRGFLLEWRQAAVDAEKLRTEAYKDQVRFLKDQLNPHFLFNSLNVLTNIVYEDADKAAEYIRQLSRFYRYVLEVQDEELVPLKQELEFTQRYFRLQQSRFGEALQLDLKLNGRDDYLLPPMVTQLLLENAIKHNQVSQNNPLRVEIQQKKDELVIRNNCNPKTSLEESTGIGLKNIRERYRLLSNKDVQVTHDDRIFEVHIPLLQINPEKNPQ